MTNYKFIRLAVFLIPLVFILSQCFDFKKQQDARGNEYAGSATCISCHKGVYNSYLHTAHFIASQPTSGRTIQGNFANGINQFLFNPKLKVVMDKRDSGFYQTSYVNGQLQQSYRFDIVFGGIKGQTYAYWLGNELYQLPISYDVNAHKWINSPGYDATNAVFNRAVKTRCLDCHVSYIKADTTQTQGFHGGAESFEKKSLVYSVDCERCHGPATAHVKFHTDNPYEKKAKYMVAFSSLSREQKINMCAVCHSGAGNRMLKPTFGFKPGDTLSRYMRLTAITPDNYKTIDVHGNQRGLLESSKCFINSTMDCTSCHNTHVNERDNTLLYAARCNTCHGVDSHKQCSLTNRLNASLLVNNCISCHMPAFSSKAIIAGQSGIRVHTHHIAVYPEETQKILAYLKVQGKAVSR